MARSRERSPVDPKTEAEKRPETNNNRRVLGDSLQMVKALKDKFFQGDKIMLARVEHALQSVENDISPEGEGLPVEEIINILRIGASVPKNFDGGELSREQMGELADKLEAKSKKYFDKHPLKGDDQHPRTRQEAFYIHSWSQEHPEYRTALLEKYGEVDTDRGQKIKDLGLQDQDYYLAMEVMNNRRELSFDDEPEELVFMPNRKPEEKQPEPKKSKVKKTSESKPAAKTKGPARDEKLNADIEEFKAKNAASENNGPGKAEPKLEEPGRPESLEGPFVVARETTDYKQRADQKFIGDNAEYGQMIKDLGPLLDGGTEVPKEAKDDKGDAQLAAVRTQIQNAPVAKPVEKVVSTATPQPPSVPKSTFMNRVNRMVDHLNTDAKVAFRKFIGWAQRKIQNFEQNPQARKATQKTIEATQNAAKAAQRKAAEARAWYVNNDVPGQVNEGINALDKGLESLYESAKQGALKKIGQFEQNPKVRATAQNIVETTKRNALQAKDWYNQNYSKDVKGPFSELLQKGITFDFTDSALKEAGPEEIKRGMESLEELILQYNKDHAIQPLKRVKITIESVDNIDIGFNPDEDTIGVPYQFVNGLKNNTENQKAITEKFSEFLDERGDTLISQNTESKAEKESNEIRTEIGGSSRASWEHPKSNQDAYFIDSDSLAVFDGVGGQQGGEYASHEARDFLQGYLAQMDSELTPEEIQAYLVRGVEIANAYVYEHTPAEFKKGTANTTAIVGRLWRGKNGEAKLIAANVGDSRMYRIKSNGEVSQITVDDSQAMNELTREKGQEYALNIQNELSNKDYDDLSDEAKVYYRFRNVITNAVGLRPDEFPGAKSYSVDLEPGDRILFTTDGVHDNLSDIEIKDIISGFPADATPEEISGALVDAAYERSRTLGGRAKADDITAVVMTLEKAR